MLYIQTYSMNSPKAPNIDSVSWVTVATICAEQAIGIWSGGVVNLEHGSKIEEMRFYDIIPSSRSMSLLTKIVGVHHFIGSQGF